MQAFLSGKDRLGQIWRKASQKKKKEQSLAPQTSISLETQDAQNCLFCVQDKSENSYQRD